MCYILQNRAVIDRLRLVESRSDVVRRPASKVRKSYNGKMQVPAMYPDNIQQKVADSFSEGMFQLLLTRLDSILSIACGI